VLGFRVCFTPRQGYFSVFARATRALSVYQEYLGLERGRPGFTQDFTSLALLRIRLGSFRYAYGAITRSGPPFQVVLLTITVLNAVLQPPKASLWVWPSPRSLAATDGISSISFPRVTKMFQFARLALLAESCGFATWGCPIRIPRDHSLGAAPPRFSQLSASFIASDSLTIHPTPLKS
jgi:hypothetical protein